jgi:phosphoglycerate dehydrogenase-like enzyme
MTRIVCLSPFSAERVRELAGTDTVEVLLVPEPPAPAAVREVVPEADIVIGDMRHGHRLGRDALATMRRCRLVQQPAVGFDTIDHRAAAGFGIPVANAAGFNADAVADWTVMGMLNVVRHGAWADREMRTGGWRRRGGPPARDLRALTVGLVGMGNIGQQVAARLGGFGSHVLYYDVVARDLPGCEPVSFDELLRRSDVVTIHMPLDATAGAVFGPAEFGRMANVRRVLAGEKPGNVVNGVE